MHTLKKIFYSNYYFIFFVAILLIFSLSTPQIFRSGMFITTNYILGLYLVIYSHLIFPGYFNLYFCYLGYCFGINWLLFTTHYTILYILSHTNEVSITNFSIYYYNAVIVFISLLILTILFCIFIINHNKYSLVAKRILIIGTLSILLIFNYILQLLLQSNIDTALSFYSVTLNILFVILCLLIIGFVCLVYFKNISNLSSEFFPVILALLFILIQVSLYKWLLFDEAQLFYVFYPLSLLLFCFTLRNIPPLKLTHLLNHLIDQDALHNMNTLKTRYEYEHLYTQYHHLLSLYPDTLFLLDMNGTVLQSSSKAHSLLEVDSHDDLVGTSISAILPDKDYTYVLAVIQRICSNESSHFTLCSQVITRTGKSIEVEIMMLPLYSPKQQQLIFSVKDISDKVYTHTLEQQFNLEKLKLEFFSSLSHELKTPINVIYSASQLQEQFAQDEDFIRMTAYTSMISTNCLRLLKLINNILDLTRLDSNHFKTSPQVINIITATEDLLTSTLPYADTKKISLIFDTDVEELYCSIDPNMLERIFLNLFSNAIKYGKIGGHLTVTASHMDNIVQISVIDDGIGIPQAAQSEIFTRFSRVDSALTRSNDGAGIGLSLVKSFVELNQGSILFSSIEDIGTEFILRFPTMGVVPPSDYNPDAQMLDSSKVGIEFADITF